MVSPSMVRTTGVAFRGVASGEGVQADGQQPGGYEAEVAAVDGIFLPLM